MIEEQGRAEVTCEFCRTVIILAGGIGKFALEAGRPAEA